MGTGSGWDDGEESVARVFKKGGWCVSNRFEARLSKKGEESFQRGEKGVPWSFSDCDPARAEKTGLEAVQKRQSENDPAVGDEEAEDFSHKGCRCGVVFQNGVKDGEVVAVGREREALQSAKMDGESELAGGRDGGWGEIYTFDVVSMLF